MILKLAGRWILFSFWLVAFMIFTSIQPETKDTTRRNTQAVWMLGTRRRLVLSAVLGHSLATTHPSSTPHPSTGARASIKSSRGRPTNTPWRAPEQTQNNVSTRGSSTLMNSDDEDDDDEPGAWLQQDAAARWTRTSTPASSNSSRKQTGANNRSVCGSGSDPSGTSGSVTGMREAPRPEENTPEPTLINK